MITGVGYKCVPAAGPEKPPFYLRRKPEPSDTDHEPPGRKVELKYVNTNCR